MSVYFISYIGGRHQGVFTTMLLPTTRQQLIATDDIAALAMLMFEQPHEAGACPDRALPANEQIRIKSKLPPSSATPRRSRRMEAFLCFLRELIRAASRIHTGREMRWSQ